MAGPIAKARHVAHRSRRQGTSSLFRATLSVALVLTSALAVMAARSALTQSSAVGSAPVASQVAVDGLANGACMSFAPTTHGRGKTVFLDPGHGGLDPGVVGVSGGRQVLEKDIALAVSTRLTALLRAAGYTVVISPSTTPPGPSRRRARRWRAPCRQRSFRSWTAPIAACGPTSSWRPRR